MSDVELSKRESIERMQAILSAMPQYEPETTHHFAEGLYCRWVFRKAGTLVVGKVHKKQHFYLVIQGELQIADGIGEPKTVKAPYLIVSEPGTKRAVYAVTDAICATFHQTDKTDLDEIERELVEDDPSSMYAVGNTLKLKEVEIT